MPENIEVRKTNQSIHIKTEGYIPLYLQIQAILVLLKTITALM